MLASNANIDALVKVFNSIWESEIYPNFWKNTKVALIPKEGKYLSAPFSYRPIWLLPIWVKVFDRIVTKRLCNYLEANNLLKDT